MTGWHELEPEKKHSAVPILEFGARYGAQCISLDPFIQGRRLRTLPGSIDGTDSEILR